MLFCAYYDFSGLLVGDLQVLKKVFMGWLALGARHKFYFVSAPSGDRCRMKLTLRVAFCLALLLRSLVYLSRCARKRGVCADMYALRALQLLFVDVV